MKKFTIAFIIAGILIVAGIALCIVAAAMTNFDISQLNSMKNLEKQEKQENSAEISEIIIEDKLTNIVLKESDNDSISISYYENEHFYYTFQAENGKLTLKKTDNTKWYMFFGITVLDIDYRVELSVPKSFVGSITLKTTNGTVSAKGLNIKGDLNIDTTHGEVKLTNLSTEGGISINTKNDDISLNNVNSGKAINAKNKNGDINASTVTSTGDQIFETANDDIELTNVKANGKLSVSSSNGSIDVDMIFALKSIELKTTNDDIEGTINGKKLDYVITSKTKSGENNLGNNDPGSGIPLNVETRNGDIDITFAD